MTDLLDLDTALEQMLSSLEPPSHSLSLPLSRAEGHYLAEQITATSAVPPFANSAMDGYAVASDDAALSRGAPLFVSQRIFAGQPPGPRLEPGCCARIFTGAPLPEGADAIIAQEDAEVLPDGWVRFHEATQRGRFVRRRGGDVETGQHLATAGDYLDAARIGLLIAAGIHEVHVHPRPRVAVITTGDELRPPGATLAPGQIYDSNGAMLAALARENGADVMSVVHAMDDPAHLQRTFEDAAAADAIICSGGVSVGEADHVRDVLGAAGNVQFWRLALKPGKPFAFGHFHRRPFFGLPGNPVSSWVTFLLLLRPALKRLAGARQIPAPLRIPATLGAAVKKSRGRRDFQRGHYRISEANIIEVTADTRQDSNVLSTLTTGNCLIDLPRDQGDLEAGSQVWIMPI